MPDLFAVGVTLFVTDRLSATLVSVAKQLGVANAATKQFEASLARVKAGMVMGGAMMAIGAAPLMVMDKLLNKAAAFQMQMGARLFHIWGTAVRPRNRCFSVLPLATEKFVIFDWLDKQPLQAEPDVRASIALRQDHRDGNPHFMRRGVRGSWSRRPALSRCGFKPWSPASRTI